MANRHYGRGGGRSGSGYLNYLRSPSGNSPCIYPRREIPPSDRYYTSPYSRGKPNHYHVPGFGYGSTHGMILTRRQYVAEFGAVSGYGYRVRRKTMFQSLIDHKFIYQPYYCGYHGIPGYQLAPM